MDVNGPPGAAGDAGGAGATGPDGADALEHLWNAAHEMLRAMRTLLDAADEFVESQRAPRAAGPDGSARPSRVQPIDIDLRRAAGDAGTGRGAGAAPRAGGA